MQTQSTEFDAAATLQAIKIARSVRKKRRTWGKSKLVKYREHLLRLKNEGASYQDIAFYLAKYHKLKVNKSTIFRYLEKVNCG